MTSLQNNALYVESEIFQARLYVGIQDKCDVSEVRQAWEGIYYYYYFCKEYDIFVFNEVT